ncbi:class V lanthionine synthetase subunit LxmK [Streptomyces vinaceus]|uniref:class V lanthionine synthetase subunit LxmK n=1 Tax=Streptomyces vinaceus TaxID=1960 RepID=UPI0037F921B4
MSVEFKLAPADLRSVPEVEQIVEREGLGLLSSESLSTFPGRNENWAGTTSTGAEIFVKKIDGPHAAERFRRALSFTLFESADIPSPKCISWDNGSHVFIFELLDGSCSGNKVARDGSFTAETAFEAGRIVGRLHQVSCTEVGLDTTPPNWPQLAGLTNLSVSTFAACSGAQLELFALLQGDAALVDSITELVEVSRQAPKAPAHCDLRLDQFLVHEGKLYLGDWEELRAEDPARDVGAFIGEWVYRAVQAIGENGDATAETVLSCGVRELERRRPFLEAFWSGYRAACTVSDPGLRSRSTAFAGWHLVDRVLASSTERSRLHALDRATIGIARNLVCSPDLFCEAVGLSTTVEGVRS